MPYTRKRLAAVFGRKRGGRQDSFSAEGVPGEKKKKRLQRSMGKPLFVQKGKVPGGTRQQKRPKTQRRDLAHFLIQKEKSAAEQRKQESMP